MFVKLNPSLNPQKSLQFGTLQYPIFMLDYQYEVVDQFKDINRGDMLKVKCPEIFGDVLIVFVKNDCIVI